MSQMPFIGLNVSGIDPNAAVASMSQRGGGSMQRPPQQQAPAPDPTQAQMQILNRQYESEATAVTNRQALRIEQLRAQQERTRQQYKMSMEAGDDEAAGQHLREMHRLAVEDKRLQQQITKVQLAEAAESGIFAEEVGGQFLNGLNSVVVDGMTSTMSAMSGQLEGALDGFIQNKTRVFDFKGRKLDPGESRATYGALYGDLAGQPVENKELNYWQWRDQDGFGAEMSRYYQIADALALHGGSEEAAADLTDMLEALNSASEMTGSERQQMLKKAGDAYKMALEKGVNPFVVGAGLYKLKELAAGEATIAAGAESQARMTPTEEGGKPPKASGSKRGDSSKDKAALAKVLSLVPTLDGEDGKDLVKGFSPDDRLEAFSGKGGNQMQTDILEVLAIAGDFGSLSEMAAAFEEYESGEATDERIMEIEARLQGYHPSVREYAWERLSETLPQKAKVARGQALKDLDAELPGDLQALQAKSDELEEKKLELELARLSGSRESSTRLVKQRDAEIERLDNEVMGLMEELEKETQRLDDIYIRSVRGIQGL